MDYEQGITEGYEGMDEAGAEDPGAGRRVTKWNGLLKSEICVIRLSFAGSRIKRVILPFYGGGIHIPAACCGRIRHFRLDCRDGAFCRAGGSGASVLIHFCNP